MKSAFAPRTADPGAGSSLPRGLLEHHLRDALPDGQLRCRGWLLGHRRCLRLVLCVFFLTLRSLFRLIRLLFFYIRHSRRGLLCHSRLFGHSSLILFLCVLLFNLHIGRSRLLGRRSLLFLAIFVLFLLLLVVVVLVELVLGVLLVLLLILLGRRSRLLGDGRPPIRLLALLCSGRGPLRDGGLLLLVVHLHVVLRRWLLRDLRSFLFLFLLGLGPFGCRRLLRRGRRRLLLLCLLLCLLLVGGCLLGRGRPLRDPLQGLLGGRWRGGRGLLQHVRAYVVLWPRVPELPHLLRGEVLQVPVAVAYSVEALPGDLAHLDVLHLAGKVLVADQPPDLHVHQRVGLLQIRRQIDQLLLFAGAGIVRQGRHLSCARRWSGPGARQKPGSQSSPVRGSNF
mmetsp:Transcript_97327/g.256936  ORF Transcript_97327/g.256936 Transcript_97327/m.256936 type:complete len:395 (+) Transcript_97327:103-1287(+)